MLLVPIKNLPIIEAEPLTDWAIVSHQINESPLNYLAYAVKRDFLSTPRTYAILAIKQQQGGPVKIKEFLLEEYLNNKQIARQELDNGFYRIDMQQDVLLLIINNKLFEMEASDFSHLDTLYYCLDANTALNEYLEAL
jgi:hypothetical protein